MRAQTLPAVAGWRWITSGFAIFRRNPPILGLLVLAYWFALLLLNVLPVIGALAASLLVPGFSVGLMQAARNVERGEPASIQTLLAGFKENTRTLLALGALYLFLTLGVLGISSLVDGGQLLHYMLLNDRSSAPAVDDADLILPALLVMLLLTPVMMAYWFAPVLAAWHRLSLAKSLFFSFVACWINWRSFLAYSAGLLLVAALLPLTLLGILLFLFPGAPAIVASIVTVPMVLIVAPVVFASFYASYRDIFGISEIV